MKQKFGKRLNYFHYANFVFQAVPKSEVLFGTMSIDNLKSFRVIEKSEIRLRCEIEEFKDVFFRANLFNWNKKYKIQFFLKDSYQDISKLAK